MNLIEADLIADVLAECRPRRQDYKKLPEYVEALRTWEILRSRMLVVVANNINVEEKSYFNTAGFLQRSRIVYVAGIERQL